MVFWLSRSGFHITKSLWHQFMKQCQFKPVNAIGGLIRAHLKRGIPDSSSCSLPMVHSSFLPYFEHVTSPNSCCSYLDFDEKCKELALESQVESTGGRNIEVSKGVVTFKSYSTPSYHLANDVPLLLYPISGSKQAETYFIFVGSKAVRNFPALTKELQPDFILVPAACCDLSCIFTCPKAGHHELILSTPTCVDSCDSYGVSLTSLLPLMLGDTHKCVNQDPNVILTSLVHASTDVQHDWFIVLSLDGQVVPNQQQLGSNYTTLHNQIRDFSSFNEHHYEDPYLVHVNGKLLHSFIPMTTNYVIYCVGDNMTIHA